MLFYLLIYYSKIQETLVILQPDLVHGQIPQNLWSVHLQCRSKCERTRIFAIQNVDEIRQYVLWSFQTGGTKLERFLPKNQHTQRKFLNFENWPQLLAKTVFKIDYFILPIFLVPKLTSVAQNEWKKTPIYILFTFRSKINEFERKKLEKNKKMPKT